MKIFKALLVGLLIAVTMPAISQEMEKPEGFEFIVGPRVGATYVFTTSEDFTDLVSELYPGQEYFPLYTLFGINFEQRILLGETQSHFAFQELILVGGLEQSVALPIAAALIGYRGSAGFEFGTGPIVNLAGVGVIVAVGWTYSFKGVFIPFDFSVILPTRDKPAAISFTTGFNFRIRRKMPDTF